MYIRVTQGSIRLYGDYIGIGLCRDKTDYIGLYRDTQ